MKNFRKGSMGAADKKSEKLILIGATVVVLLILSMLYFNFPHTFFNDWHKSAADFWKYTGWIPLAASIGWMWFGKDVTFGEKGGKEYGLISILLIVLGICMSCGWNFDLK